MLINVLLLLQAHSECMTIVSLLTLLAHLVMAVSLLIVHSNKILFEKESTDVSRVRNKSEITDEENYFERGSLE